MQVSGEAIVIIIEETSSSIADMIKELSQAKGSDVPMIDARGASTSVLNAPEGSFQLEDSHEGFPSPTP